MACRWGPTFKLLIFVTLTLASVHKLLKGRHRTSSVHYGWVDVFGLARRNILGQTQRRSPSTWAELGFCKNDVDHEWCIPYLPDRECWKVARNRSIKERSREATKQLASIGKEKQSDGTWATLQARPTCIAFAAAHPRRDSSPLGWAGNRKVTDESSTSLRQ